MSCNFMSCNFDGPSFSVNPSTSPSTSAGLFLVHIANVSLMEILVLE